MAKYITLTGLSQFKNKLETIFVLKNGDKVLSTNDYTTEEKTKLNGLSNYSLPVATAETLGGIKIGTGLSISEGVVSVQAGGVADSVNWSGIQNKPTTLEGYGITDAVSSATLDAAGYLTANDISGKANTADLSAVATSNSYNDLDNRPTIPTVPTKVSDFTNDANYATVDYVNGKVTGVYHFKGSVANLEALLAIQDPVVGDVYNLTDSGMNAGWTGTAWDEFGTVANFSEYYTKTQVDALIETATSNDIDNLFI